MTTAGEDSLYNGNLDKKDLRRLAELRRTDDGLKCRKDSKVAGEIKKASARDGGHKSCA